MEVTVLRPGALTSVQDLGRPGRRAQGVPAGGAVDAVSLELANLLVGNPPGAAALECTLVGPRLKFSRNTTIALAGAPVETMPHLASLRIHAGEILPLERIIGGCRAYLAIRGGIDVPLILDSRSTELRGGWGGFHGRALRRGDLLPIGRDWISAPARHCHIPANLLSDGPAGILRILPGANADEITPPLAGLSFSVSLQSDRMGVRLDGPRLHAAGAEHRSTPVTPGTIQVPPDGRPIILQADAQTIGGYPQIGHVASVDLPKVAQLRPGDRVTFQPITLDAAQALWIDRQRMLARIRLGIENARR